MTPEELIIMIGKLTGNELITSNDSKIFGKDYSEF